MIRHAVTVLFTSAVVLAQSNERPVFEVASIKANHSASTSTHSDRDNNRLNIVNMTLKRYISRAYSVREDQIVGPGWLDTERFDLVAKSDFIPTAEQVGLMLQALLAERFKLALHRGSKEGHVYALVVAKGGLKIKPVEPTGDSSTNSTRATLDGKQVSMDRLANALSVHAGLDVIDQTGVSGVFDVKLAWDPAATALSPDAPAEARQASDAGSSLFTALQEQLGLKLESRKMPVDILVIDHIERVPTEN